MCVTNNITATFYVIWWHVINLAQRVMSSLVLHCSEQTIFLCIVYNTLRSSTEKDLSNWRNRENIFMCSILNILISHDLFWVYSYYMQIEELIVIYTILALAQENFKCPDDYGFYPHHSSCDKYWKCDNGAAELKTCGNGLAFEANDPKYLTENCDYHHNVDCGDRSQLGKNNFNFTIEQWNNLLFPLRTTNFICPLSSLVRNFPWRS